MARGQVRIRLDGLDKARTRIKALNGQGQRPEHRQEPACGSAAATTLNNAPSTPAQLAPEFKMEIRRRFLRLMWGGGQVTYAAIANERGSSKGYAEAIARTRTAQDIAAYATTGRKPRLRAARRFGNNRNSV